MLMSFDSTITKYEPNIILGVLNRVNDTNDVSLTNATERVQNQLNYFEGRLYSLNNTDAMKQLVGIHQYLELAFAASSKSAVSPDVLTIMLQFQDLTNEADRYCSTSLDLCLEALRHHQDAIECANEGDLQMAFSVFQNTANLATDMAEETNKLIKHTDKLSKDVAKTMIDSQKEVSYRNNKQEEFFKQTEDLQAQIEKLKIQKKNYKKEIEKSIIKTNQAEKKANTAVDNAATTVFISQIISPVTQFFLASASGAPAAGIGYAAKLIESHANEQDKERKELTNKPEEIEQKLDEKTKLLEEKKSEEDPNQEEIQQLEQKIEKLKIKLQSSQVIPNQKQSQVEKVDEGYLETAKFYRELQSLAEAREREFQDKLIESESDLTELVTRLEQYHLDNNDLGKTITSLGIAVSTLGLIRTVFMNIERYWFDVKRQYTHLSNEKKLENFITSHPNAEKFINGLEISAWNWLAFGRINYRTSQVITETRNGINDSLSNLPSQEQCKFIVDNHLRSLHKKSTIDLLQN